VYTPTDVHLLERIGDAVSAHLRHLEQAEVIRQSQDRQDALRRYVPAPVADVLDSGGELEPEERDVTVLFVDLRGYTSLCEPLRPEEIFTTVNRYTDAISWVIRQHGGTIVEFSGDGLMAIFGAPHPQPGKEASAVRAARELVVALRALERPAPDKGPLTVGVGIATGPALCGNVRAAENVIWTAVGNIVNLAARLQTLTREIDALIAIDAATYRLAGSVASTFHLRQNVPIRGRSEPENVYVLPLSSQAAAA
jgi:adenylate cyclase